MLDRVRIVLDSDVVEEDLYPLIIEHNWWIKSRIGRDGDQPREFIYGTDDEQTNIHLIIDHKIGVNYLLVAGPQTQPIVQILRRKLLHYPSAEIMSRARDVTLSSSDYRQALYHLALERMDHGFDKETFEIFSRAMKSTDPIVRGAAVLGSAYLGWPQLAEPMRALTGGGESDESIRADAGLLVGRLDQSAR